MAAMASPVADCPRCRGRGFVVISDPSGRDRARRCGCGRTTTVEERLAVAGVPARYASCTLESFHTPSRQTLEHEQLLRAKVECQRYVEDFLDPQGGSMSSGLLFVGRPGSGKTHLAIAVLRDVMSTYGVRGRFVDFTDLIHRLQASFEQGSTTSKRQLLDPLRNAGILVLDELGAQKPSPFVQDVLYLLINGRYAQRLPTLFTTNYALPVSQGSLPGGESTRLESLDRGPDREHLGHRIQASLISRLYEMARPVVLDHVRDFRELIQRPRHLERSSNAGGA